MTVNYNEEQIKILKDLMRSAAIASIEERNNIVKVLKETAVSFNK